ncbi:hypothetical protein [Actinomadura sp. 9N215]|uniref:hypothetical protein n=1 Tax=Actinomadura sp. 9N215 TaxID=3375150 RepID=UPI003790FE6A
MSTPGSPPSWLSRTAPPTFPASFRSARGTFVVSGGMGSVFDLARRPAGRQSPWGSPPSEPWPTDGSGTSGRLVPAGELDFLPEFRAHRRPAVERSPGEAGATVRTSSTAPVARSAVWPAVWVTGSGSVRVTGAAAAAAS